METSIFNKKELDKLKKNISGLESDDEFEIMFGGYNKHNHINMKKFLDIMKYLKNLSEEKKYKIEYSNSLDISYGYDKNNYSTYRITIDTLDKINMLMSSLNSRKNHIIFSILASKILNGKDENLSIMNKIKDFNKTYNIDDYDIRVRMAKEKKVTQEELEDLATLEKVNKLDINFRYKNRLSVILESNSDVELRIDLTSVKQGNNINAVQSQPYIYELELDLNKKKKLSSKKETEYINLMLSNVSNIKKVIEQSNHLISNTEKSEVLDKYKELIFGKNSMQKSLYGMTTQSLEVVHIVDYLPNRFSITDKADGDRVLGLINNNKLYLIFSNLEVLYTGIVLDKKLNKYNGTIIDGEYIFIAKSNKFLLASFDILFYCGDDIRDYVNLQDRYNKLDDVLRNCFDYSFSTKEYKNNFDLEKINEHYKSEMISYMKNLNDRIKKSKEDNIVTKKYFIFVTGGSDSEVFKYSSSMWYLYTKSNDVDLPYTLDGIIFTPQEQKYTANLRETKYRIYKWKPPNQNTIDFFVRFEKNSETGKVITVYDDANEENVSGKVYKIINLYNGKNINNIEVPTLFKREDNLHIAHLEVDENTGVARDEEGDIIQDNTVVEFAYNDNMDIPFHFRWVPLRTRHDKTESVVKYKKKYGNNNEIANKIWNSIQQNVTIEDISLLADPKKFDDQMNELKKRIDASVVAIEKQQDAYYQKITNLAKPMRDFHNYIKSNIIFGYCSPKDVNGRQQKLSVLDIACGRGGDIQKFFHSRVKNYVGVDVDSNGIHSSTNGAISRYITFKKKMPNMPKMDFMVADAGSLLNYENQLKAQGKMTSTNEILLKKYFGNNVSDGNYSKFDVINCQLALHFFLKNNITWSNYCDNLNKFLEDDGYFLVTTFDGDMIHNKFNKENGKISSHYTEDGESKKFFEFTRNYSKDEKDINKTGLTYKSFVTLIKDDESKFDLEYIVGKDFLIKELKEKCNLDLVETDLFYNTYKQQEHFFQNIAPTEERKETKSYFMKVRQYFNQEDSVNSACLEFTKYHRYFIFKKRHVSSSKKTSVLKSEKRIKKVSIKKTSNKKDKKKRGGLIDKYLQKRTNLVDI